MSLSKELFGILQKANGYAEAKLVEGKEVIAYRWPQEMIDGYNQALDEIDQFEISEEELTKIIEKERWGAAYEYLRGESISPSRRLAKAIIQNKPKIFKRKI